MKRPFHASKTLGFGPLMETRGADSSGVEGVPAVAALTGPQIAFLWLPHTSGTSYVRATHVIVRLFRLEQGIGPKGGKCSHIFLYTFPGHSIQGA